MNNPNLARNLVALSLTAATALGATACGPDLNSTYSCSGWHEAPGDFFGYDDVVAHIDPNQSLNRAKLIRTLIAYKHGNPQNSGAFEGNDMEWPDVSSCH